MRMHRLVVLLSALIVVGCTGARSLSTTSSSQTETTATTVETSTTTTPVLDERFAGFSSCDAGGAPGVWLCGVLDVPVDRSDPAAGSISIKVWARPRTDTGASPSDPVFTTPGGPGKPGLENYAVFWLSRNLGADRDFITIDPRGIGSSGVIDCPDLQDGFDELSEWAGLVGECGASLGGASDRYGAADRAMDLEAVREWLGYDRIVYHGVSYGGVDAQAYAARYPDRLSALVLDASWPMGESNYEWTRAIDQAGNAMRVAELACSVSPVCAEATSDPSGVLRRLVDAIADTPLVGTASKGTEVAVDETYLAEAAIEMDLPALILAGVEYESGNPQALLDFAAENPSWYRSGGYGPDVMEFSAGANVAAWCNDAIYPYEPGDPIEVRRQKLDAAIAGLADDVYAPWTKEAMNRYVGLVQCVLWPAPDRHEPVLPSGSGTLGVPVLILVGDRDRWVPIEASRRLLAFFPDASFVVVAGVGHPALSYGECVADLISEFIETRAPIDGVMCG